MFTKNKSKLYVCQNYLYTYTYIHTYIFSAHSLCLFEHVGYAKRTYIHTYIFSTHTLSLSEHVGYAKRTYIHTYIFSTHTHTHTLNKYGTPNEHIYIHIYSRHTHSLSLLQLLHALLQIKKNSTYEYKPSKSQCKTRHNAESGQESGGARRHARGCPVARAGGAQHATEPHRTPNERYATQTILHELYTPSNTYHIHQKGQIGIQHERK